MATIDAARLICLDETSTPTPLTSLRARAARGQRAYGRMPRGRQAAGSWLATLTVQGLGASLLVRGAVDRLVCEPFGERVLAPTRRPGHIVVLDHRSVHQSARAGTLIEAAGGHVVFLPTYAPDLKPIEPAFATTKQALRRAEARSFATIAAAGGETLPTITISDAQAFFADAGFPVR